MAEGIEKVPAEARWQIATRGLTSTVSAYAMKLREALGDDKYKEISGEVWSKAGEGAKQFADGFGFSASSAPDLAELTKSFAMAALGPEFEIEDLESKESRSVTKLTKCPWSERAREAGLSPLCQEGHQKWGESVLQALNPGFTYTVTKSIPSGDSHCEIVIERKR